MGEPSYDRSEWPLLRIRMPAAGLSPSELDAHLEVLRALFSNGERFAFIIDARGAKPLEARQRQALGRLLKGSFVRDPLVVAGIGVVLSSALERGILTAVTWAAGRTYPMRAFATPEEAASWLRALLAPTSPRERSHSPRSPEVR